MMSYEELKIEQYERDFRPIEIMKKFGTPCCESNTREYRYLRGIPYRYKVLRMIELEQVVYC